MIGNTATGSILCLCLIKSVITVNEFSLSCTLATIEMKKIHNVLNISFVKTWQPQKLNFALIITTFQGVAQIIQQMNQSGDTSFGGWTNT